MITKIRIQNFKAIQDSNWISTPSLTAFIGNNGSGKSSVIEALELVHLIAMQGLDEAFRKWGGLESVRNNKATLERSQGVGSSAFKVNFSPVSVEFQALLEGNSYEYKIEINSSLDNVLYIIQNESLFINSEQVLFSSVDDAEGHGTIGIKLPGETGLLIVGPS